ncbi:MAG TPA: efflux RND transporter periplasmic adaptor subunit [Candidatus Limnocylindria bacterium]|jgi:RND family efflux transporter MFP subunit|nr:efflux RND transporter periplasmic adaptor subunit [Candidatus Limnocylindria bacterium]
MTTPCSLFSKTTIRWLWALLALGMLRAGAAEILWASGITEAVNDAVMSSPVVGIISSRPFQEGARVKAGTVILELDKRLEELEVVRKRLMRDHAQLDLDRSRTLSQKSTVSISKEEVDKKQADFDVAAADYEIATEQLHRRQIIAPFDGVIVDYFLKPGEGCQALQPLVRLVDPLRCYFVASVESRVGHQLKTGEPVEVQVESGPKTVTLTGTIHFVSPVTDPASGLMKIKGVFENPGEQVRPGVSGRMKLTLPDHDK